MHLVQAFLLEAGVADRQHFVNQQNLRLEMRRNGKGQSHIHATAVSLNRSVNKFLDLSKRYDLVKLSFNLSFLHSQNRAVEKNVFPARQFWLKARAYLQQRADPPLNASLATGRLGDARKNF